MYIGSGEESHSMCIHYIHDERKAGRLVVKGRTVANMFGCASSMVQKVLDEALSKSEVHIPIILVLKIWINRIYDMYVSSCES